MFDDRLLNLRKARHLTQQELANELDLKLNTYRHYENDEREPSSMTLLRIARFFGVTIDYLLDYTPPVPPELQPYKMPPEPNRDPNAAYKMPDGSTEHGGADEKKPALARLTMSELNNRIESLEEQDLDRLIDFIKIMQSDGESKEDLSLFIEFVKWKDKKDRP